MRDLSHDVWVNSRTN